jgi:hypothetical protein
VPVHEKGALVKDDSLIERLQTLQQAPGPFVSLYMNTEADRELGPQELAGRWRGLRETAASQDVPDKALLLLDDVVEGSHLKGNGLIAFTAADELFFRRFVDAPLPDTVQAGRLPHLLPLFDWRQHHPSYAVVLIDRTQAQIHVVGGLREEQTVEVEGDHDVIRKVQAGGWSHRRFQNRAEDSWERNAEEVAERLGRIIRDEGLQLAVVMGDVRAIALLKENAAPDIAPRLHDLETAPPTEDRLEEVRNEIEAAVAALTGRLVEETLAKFLEERGQEDLAAEGAVATMAALRMSQVETLLISTAGEQRDGWFSRSDLTQGALNRKALGEIGIEDVEQARLDDVLIRVALGTGAAVCVIPELSKEHGPSEGIGAILRFTTTTEATA